MITFSIKTIDESDIGEIKCRSLMPGYCELDKALTEFFGGAYRLDSVDQANLSWNNERGTIHTKMPISDDMSIHTTGTFKGQTYNLILQPHGYRISTGVKVRSKFGTVNNAYLNKVAKTYVQITPYGCAFGSIQQMLDYCSKYETRFHCLVLNNGFHFSVQTLGKPQTEKNVASKMEDLNTLLNRINWNN